MSRQETETRIRIRKAKSFASFHTTPCELAEGVKLVIGCRTDGSKALQSVAFTNESWTLDGAKSWLRKNRELIEGGDMPKNLVELSEDVFKGVTVAGIDRERGIMRGVKLCGVKSANGHVYSDPALNDLSRLYEGTMVNLNHPPVNKPGARRDIGDRFGKVQNSKAVAGSGVTGDVVFNPKHPLAESIIWFAEHMPEAIGFSHNGAGRVVNHSGVATVESVAVVRHVDLVADPATTKSLFESMSAWQDTSVIDLEEEEELDTMDLSKLNLKELQETRPDLVTSILQESKSAQEAKEKLTTLTEENKTLKTENDEFKVAKSLSEKSGKVDKLLEESKLPKEAITDTFKNSLLEAKDEEAMKALVEDRQKLVLNRKPKSRESKLVEGKDAEMASMSSKDFASKVKGG